VQDYPVRASHRGNLAIDQLREIASAHFDASAIESNAVVVTYGAISRLAASANGRELRLDVTMSPQVPEEVARETIRRYNQFLEAVTGYTAKERAKRLRKSSGGSSSGA
jgi:hypothetical protein